MYGVDTTTELPEAQKKAVLARPSPSPCSQTRPSHSGYPEDRARNHYSHVYLSTDVPDPALKSDFPARVKENLSIVQ